MEGGNEYKKGLWTEEEDRVLMDYVRVNGKGKWNRVAKMTGLKRCGKSCRLRWINYLSPSVKRGDFSEEEEDLIIRLHKLLGNRWSLIAGRVPGRTDNQVKNHWNSHLSKKLGVKKVLTKVTSSPPHMKDLINNKVDFELLNDSTSNKVDKHGCCQNEIGLGSKEEAELISNNFETHSNWFSNIDTHFYSPLLLDPLLEFPFNFVWDGF